MPSKQLTLTESVILTTTILIVALSAGIIGYRLGNGDIRFPFEKELSSADLKITNDLINQYYDGPIDKAGLINKSIDSMILTLNDKSSYYVDKSSYQEINNEDEDKYYGIGIIYNFENSVATILDVLPNSPAERVGLKSGQKIITINNQKVSEMKNKTEVVYLFNKYKKFSLTIQTKDNKIAKIKLNKSYFFASSFNYKKIRNTVAYLKIYHFGSNLRDEFPKIATSLRKDKINKLIIDLRNNLGGDTNQTIFLVKQFLSSGIILKEQFKYGNEKNTYKADNHAPFEHIQLVLLINSETSSSAEIFASAMRDNKRAVIIGKKTYGKGTVGQYFELSDGSAVHLTIGKWFTPSGNCIQGKGIEPNIYIKDVIDNKHDKILEKALEVLKVN